MPVSNEMCSLAYFLRIIAVIKSGNIIIRNWIAFQMKSTEV